MNTFGRLQIALIEANIPILGVRGTGAVDAVIDYDVSATAQDRTNGEAILAAHDWSDRANETYVAQQAKREAAARYDRAQTPLADVTDRVIIAFAQLVLERFNFTADKFTDLQLAIAASTSLADFKTRAGAVGGIPQLTQQQLVDAIKAKIAATRE